MNIFKHLLSSQSARTRVCTSYRASISFFHFSSEASIQVHSPEQEVVIALGSNVGDRLNNFNEALTQMKKSGIEITRHACLYETEPAYVTDQPLFLNSAIRGVTKLGPHELLSTLKKIEKEMGRIKGIIRYGPRPIDLDILFYGKYRINSEILTVPHERIFERAFVMAPLVDLLGSDIDDDDTVLRWHSFSKNTLFESWEKLGGEALIGKDGLRRVLPVNNQLWDWSKRTSVMGILNLTTDSFSDGGKFDSVGSAISRVKTMISQGADIIDLGAQSTRPMATKISVEEELERLIPVLEKILELPEIEGKLLSIDTFYSEVALEAIKKGAHIINDVSGGTLDSDMFRVVANLSVPYIAMHMRGDPSTMQNSENLKYDDVCKEVADELYECVRTAELCGVPAWRMILDPGIGFSKKTEDNLDILMGLKRIRSEIGRKSLGVSRAPLLIGPSRKRFLGEICGRASAVERDPGTVAAVTCAVLGGANVVRVHNVGDNADAVKLCGAMLDRVGRS
ncbi:putative 2-amino-4-hydroxy-6-hydroxymethyldihydropteridine diphosphokinase [Helianthus annuus]|nr:putative 2-amino-4-hydroxy-6-hydroxymethyldihydropteridine diphosphokinase [Helianthus annuus]KAJ0937948.1 putative 2-amino-4-hydroxy-6-hydroxymethyldihydropteridine diphosphokinase [Helianthus annuus]